MHAEQVERRPAEGDGLRSPGIEEGAGVAVKRLPVLRREALRRSIAVDPRNAGAPLAELRRLVGGGLPRDLGCVVTKADRTDKRVLCRDFIRRLTEGAFVAYVSFCQPIGKIRKGSRSISLRRSRQLAMGPLHKIADLGLTM